MFHKAERRKAKLRLAIAGPSGSGKTYSALLLAQGLGGKIAMIDTESGSGELYANLTEYDVCTLTPPFTPQKYIDAIKAAEDAGYNVLIIDSLSHAWVGPGGLLEMHDNATRNNMNKGNSYTAWRDVTPKHNALVDAILQSKCNVIATMRSKTEYAQTEENGKKVVKRLGMSPVQRDGMEYEFTVFLDLDASHNATASKDRTGLLDGQVFTPSSQAGKSLLEWLESGVEPVKFEAPAKPEAVKAAPKAAPAPVAPTDPNMASEKQIGMIRALAKGAGLDEAALKQTMLDLTGKQSSKQLTKADASKMIEHIQAKAS